MSIIIQFPDGSKKKFDKGITGMELAKSIGERLSLDAVAISVDGVLSDLSKKINKNSKIDIITSKSKQGLEIYRHSTAHLLAQAVKNLFSKAKLTIGPVIENGFYYDFESKPFTLDDLEKIEQEMKKLSEKNLEIKRFEVSKTLANKEFKGNKYKIELIKDAEGDKVSYYQQGDFKDLCRGPHVPSTSRIKYFKLMRVSGSYWRGDARNQPLQRIYGTAFSTKKELNKYIHQLEEAKTRDHKLIGERMNLYMLSNMIGRGLPVWLPKGEIMKNEIEKLAVETEEKAGYVRVSTPHLAKKELFLKSGHLPHYEKDMYPVMKLDDGNYYLKAMNCPLHHEIYTHKSRSYRELPLRISEYGTVYRNELSGSLSGLLRVRMLSMNDAHIYCTKKQIESEIKNILVMTKKYYDLFGLKDYYFRLSLWEPKNKDKYIDEPTNWAYTEKKLKSILKKLKVDFEEISDEAAFYGPKIDIQFRTVTGREETMSTIQLDFAAKKRFGLKFTDVKGELNNEVFVIHRAPLSTHERLIAFLIEHYAGRFPLWLAPVQVRIMTITDEFNKYAEFLEKKLKSKNVRVELDLRSQSMNKKVRDAQSNLVPIMLTIGKKEVDKKTVSVRTLNGEVTFGIKSEDFLKKVVKNISVRSNSISFKK